MQIYLYISNRSFDKDFKLKIDKTHELHKYSNILPKSIKISMINDFNLNFIEKVIKIFDNKVTKFLDIKCYSDVESSSFLSNIAKNVSIWH